MRMREKAALAVLTVTLLAVGFCGCAKRAAEPNINVAEQLSQPFVCSVEVHSGENKAAARLVRQAPGCSRIEFTAPRALEGLSVELTTGSASLNYAGLQMSLQPGTLPEGAIPSILVGVLDAASREGGVQAERKDGKLVLTGNAEFGAYTLVLDEKSGALSSLSVPAHGFEAIFSGFERTA